ncbi:uncharacterized protein LOC107048082 [Diachasma alloeum]|uniref:uncharacterized protein LOC107048082 n=1 Tax=Diachasma alloeum TaxID=454923 RepID=UPI00073833AF|nr:uncharacterized protein LOC107048082 [Diachasma alloeum]
MNFNFITVLLCVLCSYTTVGVRGEKQKCTLRMAEYYEELGCQPLYANESHICAPQYSCKNIENRNPDVCYLHGVEYPVGSSVDGGFRIECRCTKQRPNATPQFVCHLLRECSLPPPPGCFRTTSSRQNCVSPVQCIKKPGVETTCHVNGKVYKIGQYFEPTSDPGQRCYCGHGYTGQNIAPYCTYQSEALQDIELVHGEAVANGCAPVFKAPKSPGKRTPLFFRCHREDDYVVKGRPLEERLKERFDMVECKFGNFTMKYGDELNPRTDAPFDNVPSDCMICLCLIGPVPMCQLKPYERCKPKFGSL